MSGKIKGSEWVNNDIILKIYRRTIVLSLFIIGSSFFLFRESKAIILGYLFGTMISMLSLKLLDNTINKAVLMEAKKAYSYTVFHYFLRYIIYFVVLSTSIIADYLNFLSAALGLVIIKVVIFLSTIFDKNFIE